MKRILLALLLLTACDSDEWTPGPCGSSVASPGGTLNPNAWYIGPKPTPTGGGSVGMPLHPSPHKDGWSFEIPTKGRHANYLTFNHGPLTGKTRITMRYRIEAEPGIQIHPHSTGEQNWSQLAPYFQRRDDNWKPDREHYRWYVAEKRRHMPLRPGEYELTVSLDPSADWVAAVKSVSSTSPALYRQAINLGHCVGFVLGGGDGVGHGVYASGPARFVLISYRVE